MNIHDYQLLEQVAVTASGKLHVARRLHDGITVILKLLDTDNASAIDEARLRHEHTLLQLLDARQIIKPIALHDEADRVAMVLERFAGEWLESVLARGQRFALPTVLSIAIQLTRALAALHAASIVHHDIRPVNILVACEDGEIRLADLSRATSREHEAFVSDSSAAVGDWAYISPEQTGRMNRPVDYRTDFYSLGVTLHRLLTGRLPFQADDPLGWVHCHIARLPPIVSDLVPEIPQSVSTLVLKLLAKAPEDRYQSAGGLLADLEHCLSEWQAAGRIDPFTLGRDDVADSLLIPHKLYGRERDIATLLSAFEDAAATGSPTLVTVSGYSGVGKSALVNELQKPIVEKCGYFLAGKFDQYKRDIPYATVAQAFQSLIRQILGESDSKIGQWRDALREALGTNGQLMINLIPELELVIGPQPPIVDLPPQETQRRFHMVFRRLLGVFAQAEHPLALFLDDLQWLDAATLDLIEHLMTHPEVRYLLLVGAFRDNEVGSNHPLMRRLNAIREAGGAVRDIVLAPLTEEDVARFVADALHCLVQHALPLAQLVFEKTDGNPFFTIQFLIALADEKLLRFDPAGRSWVWDLPRIHAKRYTDNVVDLMVGKLERLSREAQDTLKQFACLGNKADVEILSLVLGQPAPTVHASLWDAVRTGLVFRHEDTYTFLHDRVQEAAYSLIPSDLRTDAHLRIGRALASGLKPEEIAERIFDVVNQFNRGLERIEAEAERERIAELNLMAGQRARASTAYASALTYFAAGTALAPQDRWERRYELNFTLELRRAECEFLTGALTEADERLAELALHAANLEHLAGVTCLRVALFTTMVRTDRSVEVVLDYLRRIGVVWSAHPSEDEVRPEYERMWRFIGNRPIEALLDLPRTSDSVVSATMEVLNAGFAPALFTDPNLCCLVSARMANLSLEHGNSDASCVGYVGLAMVLGPFFDDYPSAFHFGQLAFDLVEKHQLAHFAARVYLAFGCGVNFWMRHVRTSVGILRRSIDAAQQAGDLTYMAYSYHRAAEALLANGAPLAETQRETEIALDFAREARFRLVIGLVTSKLRLIMTLRGLTPVLGSFGGPDFDEREFERPLEEDRRLAYAACSYWVRKLQALCFAGDHAAALAAAAKAENVLWTSPFFFEMVEYRYCAALSHAASCDTASAAERASHLQAMAKHHEQLSKWAENCPENFANRALLVAAEIARVEGREMDAQRLFEQAIHSARDNGFVYTEALAYERAAAFYGARGFDQIAELYLRNARNAYLHWGAEGKVRQLEALHPSLRATSPQSAAIASTGAAQLDLLSLAKASQAISGQLLLDELADSLLRIVLENAAAQTGYLLLARNDVLIIAAEASVASQAVQVKLHHDQPTADSPLPVAILNYVRRSKERVLLPDAVAPHSFSADPHFALHQPKSVLCLPIVRQSALIGLLYLENHLLTHAFPPERLTVLEFLASQAAISLENAQLYADLKQENQERKRAEEILRDREARIRRLVDSNIIGMFFWDAQGAITEANDAFLQMAGYSRDDLKSGALRWTDVTPQEYRAVDAQALEELSRSGRCTPYEKEVIRKDGSRIPVLIGAALFEESLDTGVAFALDLTERKQGEAERHARQAAEAANLAKSAFLASMSHELRTPLNAILGYAQILGRDKELKQRQISGLNVIQQSGEHLLTLINGILDLAKIEAGKLELNPSDIELISFLRSLADMIAVKAEQKGLTFRCDLAEDLPTCIHADEQSLRQVLLNLLSNAVKFTERGTVTLRVAPAPAARLRFEVIDTGIGIPADQLDAVFEPFVQVGEAWSRIGGTGLGLSISRKIVHQMGSDIAVESIPDKGSRFWFELEAPTAEPGGNVTAVPVDAIVGYSGPRKKILMADDIAENRGMLADMLGPLGFVLSEAVNGSECVKKAQAEKPDLILMDIVMPEMDGLDASDYLRQLPACREIPIIIVSASASKIDEEKSRIAGADAFLPKPIDFGKLLPRMADLLRINWIYDLPETQAISPNKQEAGASSGLPPTAEMDTLHHLAQVGNMRDILAWVDRVAKLDAGYHPFVSRLRELAMSYQSEVLLDLVEKQLERGGQDHAGDRR
jgi:PAS domain S-box-containing protein